MKKKILITGGAGYIGSMLTSKLVNLGHKVTVIDLLKFSSNSLNHLHLSKNFKLIVGDVRNKKLVKREIKSRMQSFPWKNWKKEFRLLDQLSIRNLEWTLDYKNFFNNRSYLFNSIFF